MTELETVYARLRRALCDADTLSELRVALTQIASDIECGLCSEECVPETLRSGAPSTPVDSDLGREYGPGGSLLTVARDG